MNNSKISRESFRQAIGCFLSQGEVAAGMEQYDKLSRFGDELATAVTLNSLGLKEASAGIAEYVQGQLAKIGTFPKPETDSVKRLKSLLSRLQKNINANSITVNGQDLTEFAREKAKISVPECLKDQMWVYTATASYIVDGKTFKEFGLETIGGGKTE